MKYIVSATELEDVAAYGPRERAQYFLNRAIESEEVWGLNNQYGWVMKKENHQTILPAWPYEQMAATCAVNEWGNYTPHAVSLEHFVDKLLPTLVERAITIELLPTPSKPGILIVAQELASIFEGMMESGEYYMEG